MLVLRARRNIEFRATSFGVWEIYPGWIEAGLYTLKIWAAYLEMGPLVKRKSPWEVLGVIFYGRAT